VTARVLRLEALLADPSRATQVPPEEAVALLVQIAALQVALLTAVSRSPTPVQREPERPEPDRMLKVEEVMALTGLSRRWLYRNAKNLPFARRLSRKQLRFSRSGLTRWLATRRYDQLAQPR
jgi:predicted DNA-binding transcriptional regulator AlpA